MSESDDEMAALMNNESHLMDKLALKERRKEMEEVENANKINHLGTGNLKDELEERESNVQNRFRFDLVHLAFF